MKIISLVAENFKRLQAVEIRPDGNLVQITGKNGNGKTSVLDSLWVALAGKDACPTVPIRRGQERAVIRLDLGELIVTRTFRRGEGDEFTTGITVENAEGARYGSPQRMLDALLGELTFDPLAFARMKPRDQFDQLRRFVPEVDFDAIDRANRGDFERRTEINRFLEQEQGAAKAIVVPEGTPEALIDEQALVEELARAGEHNTDIATRYANRERVREVIRGCRAVIENTPEEIRAATERATVLRDREIARIEEQIRALQGQIEETRTRCDQVMRGEAERLTKQADDARTQADALEKQLEGAGELPAEIDVPALERRIAEARVINANVRRLLDRQAHERKAQELQEKSKAYTAAINQRNADKLAKIAAANMPVPGIAFGDGIVLLNGVPFEQASDAEQLRASVAIAMSLNPKLRVLRVRDGSLLDSESMKILGEMCDQHDFQCWIEVVSDGERMGFVIEDGTVKEHRHGAHQVTEQAANG